MTDWTEDEITALMRGIASWSGMKRDAAIARAIAAEAREREIGEELDKATARADAAEQMVAELRAVLVRRHAHDVAGGICDTPERCSCDDDVTAILEQAAPIDGRWCLASERDAAIARAEQAEARLVQGCRGCVSDPVCRQCSDASTAEYLRSLVAAAERRLKSPTLLEALAAIEHERWSSWERYRERCVAAVRRAGDSETHEERWRRQRETAYADLSEREQESDRAEARKGLEVIRSALAGRGDRNS